MRVLVTSIKQFKHLAPKPVDRNAPTAHRNFLGPQAENLAFKNVGQSLPIARLWGARFPQHTRLRAWVQHQYCYATVINNSLPSVLPVIRALAFFHLNEAKTSWRQCNTKRRRVIYMAFVRSAAIGGLHTAPLYILISLAQALHVCDCLARLAVLRYCLSPSLSLASLWGYPVSQHTSPHQTQ